MPMYTFYNVLIKSAKNNADWMKNFSWIAVNVRHNYYRRHIGKCFYFRSKVVFCRVAVLDALIDFFLDYNCSIATLATGLLELLPHVI
jgi:hypothetical protein